MSANVDADPRDFVEGLPNIGIMLQDITEVDSSLFVTAFWSMLEQFRWHLLVLLWVLQLHFH